MSFAGVRVLREFLADQRRWGLRHYLKRAAAGPPGLAAQERALAGCQRCGLAAKRRHIVFGEGPSRPRLMFVGEGPGEEEDRQGRPFVGRAGRLLDAIIAAMGLARGEVYIANIVKCRPPDNRTPLPDEMVACFPHLEAQIARLRPELLVALGRVAAMMLCGSEESLGRLRGRFHEYRGIPVLPTYHPAYLLRNPADKPKVWEDMKLALGRLGLTPPARPPRGET